MTTHHGRANIAVTDITESMKMTKEQRVVVEHRIKDGYELLGTKPSLLNGLDSYCLVKGPHTMIVNTLGYDEYIPHHTNLFGLKEISL